MIAFKCSLCGEGMEAPQSLAGQVEKCPKCGSLNRVPPQAQAVPPPRVPPSGRRAKRGKPLLSLGVLGLAFVVAAIVVCLVGADKVRLMTASAANQEYRNTLSHLGRDAQSHMDRAWEILRDTRPHSDGASGTPRDRLSDTVSELREDRDVAAEYERARQIELTYQTWAGVLGILGLVLSILGFSYSRSEAVAAR